MGCKGGLGQRDRGTPGTPVPDPPGLCREGERCRRRSPDTQMAAWSNGLRLDLAMMESNTWDAEADVETLEARHHSQEADADPKHRAEPTPTAENAQEGRVGNSLAIWINPKCIFLTVFPNLSFWDCICPHLQTPVPAQGILISC